MNRSHLIIILISLAPTLSSDSIPRVEIPNICYIASGLETKKRLNEDKFEAFDECCQLSSRLPRHKKSHGSKLFTDYSLYGVQVVG